MHLNNSPSHLMGLSSALRGMALEQVAGTPPFEQMTLEMTVIDVTGYKKMGAIKQKKEHANICHLIIIFECHNLAGSWPKRRCLLSIL
jgi:hypothetical protein